jgi:outer membrane usher protein
MSTGAPCWRRESKRESSKLRRSGRAKCRCRPRNRKDAAALRRISPPIILLLLLLPHTRLWAQETVLLKVVVNTEDRGEYYLKLTDEGDVLITRAQLQQLGIGIKEEANVVQSVSLKSLAPDVTFRLIEGEAIVALTVNPARMGTQVKDLALRRRADVLYPETNSIFLNYTLDYAGQQNFLNLPLELAARLGPFLLLTDATGTIGQSPTLIRNQTSIVLDSRTALSRTILGDFTATSGGMGLGSSGIFGGLSITRNFSIDPYFLKKPDISVTTLLPAPASVQLFLNEMYSGAETMFTSGKIQFINIPFPPGVNTAALQMTDMAGIVSRLQELFYVGTDLLAPGIDEYSYSAGFTRQGLGINSFDYGDPAFLGFHRVGITDWLTLGARAEAGPTTVNTGPTATMTLGLLGEMNASFALSDYNGTLGYGAAAAYSYQARAFGGSASLQYVSDAYSTIAAPGGGSMPSLIASLSLSLSERWIGSLGASASYYLMRDGPDKELFTVSYSRQLSGNLQLQAILNAQLQSRNLQLGGFVGIRLLIGDALASVNYNSEGGLNSVSAGIERNVTRGNGFGYSANIDEAQSAGASGTGMFDGQAALNYHGSYGNLAASVAYNQEQNSAAYELSGAGSIVMINGTLHFAQPITDSFALVRVDGLGGVRIKDGTQYVGVTDASGNALIPGLASYSENELSIEQADIPMDHTIESTSAFISPPYRGGGVVDFKTVKFKAISGKLFFVEKGQRTPAQYAGLDVMIPAGKVSGIVGLGGAFYLENIPPGTYAARLYTQDKESRFQLVVPESADTVVDLGEIDCNVKETDEGVTPP